MKKKIGYLLLIVISIVGSRLIFGKDYHLNSDSLKEENLYVYKYLSDGNIISSYVLGEDVYYVVYNNSQYKVIKMNLISNKSVDEYSFVSKNELEKVNLFYQDGYLYLTSSNGNSYYKFDKNLNMINQSTINVNDIDIYGIYNDQIVYAVNNEIYYNNKLFGSVPISCGDAKEIIYNRDIYLHFYNNNTGFGCLYNLDDKKIEYLDYENAYYVKNKLLEYQSNRLSFKYDGNTYYFNDISESDYLKMHSSGDYLFTIDTTNNKLRVYNIESRKIIYERSVLELNGTTISNIMIDDYVYFLLNKDNKNYLYVWDYLKEIRRNKDMIVYNEKEYKFNNNELKEEIKSKYNIDVYIYDQAVDYFDSYYVVASYDDILIHSRLKTLKNILESFDESEISNISNIKICFEKSIILSNNTEEVDSIMINKNGNHVIAINITNDLFKDNIKSELLKINPNLEKIVEISE